MLVGVRREVDEGVSCDVFFFQAEDGIRDLTVTGVQTCALPISSGQIVCRANSGGVIGAPGCVPWNIFSNIGGGVSPGAVNYISTPGESKGGTTERVWDGAITGDLGKQGIKLPTAHDGLGVSFGAEYRQESSELDPDVTYQINDLAGQGAPTLPTIGNLHVTELFMEARLPLVEDAAFAKSLTLETGYRYSDYSLSFGSTHTYKLGLQWAPVSDARIRGMYQRAVRSEERRVGKEWRSRWAPDH